MEARGAYLSDQKSCDPRGDKGGKGRRTRTASSAGGRVKEREKKEKKENSLTVSFRRERRGTLLARCGGGRQGPSPLQAVESVSQALTEALAEALLASQAGPGHPGGRRLRHSLVTAWNTALSRRE